MRSTAFLMFAAALVAGPAASGFAQATQSRGDYGAKNIEYDLKNNRVLLQGSVVVHQAATTLEASRVTINLIGKPQGGGSPQASMMNASGSVVVHRPDQVARSNYAIYDLNRRLITMMGAVALTQGGNTVNGGRLTINLDTGRAVVDGSSVASSTTTTGPSGTTVTRGGRVTGTFSVPDRSAPAKGN